MVFDLILYIGGVMIRLVANILTNINFVMPSWWNMILVTLFQYLAYLQGYFPFYPDPSATGLNHSIGIMTIAGFDILFMSMLYGFKLLMKVLPMIPWLGINHHFDVSNDAALDLRPTDLGAGRVVDLRRGPRKAKRWLRDIH